VAHPSQPEWQGPEDSYPSFRYLGTGGPKEVSLTRNVLKMAAAF
jgi:hypothetical protein